MDTSTRLGCASFVRWRVVLVAVIGCTLFATYARWTSITSVLQGNVIEHNLPSHESMVSLPNKSVNVFQTEKGVEAVGRIASAVYHNVPIDSVESGKTSHNALIAESAPLQANAASTSNQSQHIPPPPNSTKNGFGTELLLEQHQSESEGPIKVILFTYMRSGSTLTGRLLSEDTDTFYLFEPIDSFYSYLYGTLSGMFPLDIYFNADGTKREIPSYERDFITKATLQLMNCNFSALPREVMFQRFIVEGYNVPQAEKFRACLLAPDSSGRRVHNPFDCQRTIEKDCPNVFYNNGTKPLQACYEHFHMEPKKEFAEKESFQVYSQCIAMAETRVSTCLQHLTSVCQQSRVRSFKAIRMLMDLMDGILRSDPDIQLLYLVRDPRGIVNSRQNAFQASHRTHVEEAILLCKRMTDDLSTFEALQTRYPSRVKRVYYEELAQEPWQQAKEIYTFMRNSTVPEAVSEFLSKSMNSSKSDGDYGIKRTNATETAHHWRKVVTGKTLEELNEACKGVLDKLGYDL